MTLPNLPKDSSLTCGYRRPENRAALERDLAAIDDDQRPSDAKVELARSLADTIDATRSDVQASTAKEYRALLDSFELTEVVTDGDAFPGAA